jgi:hypothetical protein
MAEGSFLSEAITASGSVKLSPFAGLVVMAALAGRVLSHKQQVEVEHTYGDMWGGFWERQRWLEVVLTKAVSAIPVPSSISPEALDPLSLFMCMVTQTTTLYLHEAIASKRKWRGVNDFIMEESTQKSFTAAVEISRFAKMMRNLNCFRVSHFQPRIIQEIW